MGVSTSARCQRCFAGQKSSERPVPKISCSDESLRPATVGVVVIHLRSPMASCLEALAGLFLLLSFKLQELNDGRPGGQGPIVSEGSRKSSGNDCLCSEDRVDRVETSFPSPSWLTKAFANSTPPKKANNSLLERPSHTAKHRTCRLGSLLQLPGHATPPPLLTAYFRA